MRAEVRVWRGQRRRPGRCASGQRATRCAFGSRLPATRRANLKACEKWTARWTSAATGAAIEAAASARGPASSRAFHFV